MVRVRAQSGPERRVVVSIEGLVKAVHVGFRRRKVEVLRGVDLRVEDGDAVGLLGPNGAGKTTTLKVVLGLMRPTAGVASLGVEGLHEVGFLPESACFYDYLTGREFLALCARLFDIGGEERDERITQALQEVGLEDACGKQLRKFSKGMLQRIGIAQALINDPRLVILDEPMTGLDPIGRAEVKQIILRLREEGRTVLFSSHILADVHELCTRAAIMHRGVVVWHGPVSEAVEKGGGSLERFFIDVVGAQPAEVQS